MVDIDISSVEASLEDIIARSRDGDKGCALRDFEAERGGKINPRLPPFTTPST
jgi:hypothetical protein